jgi:hypothetical protein
VRTTIAIPVKQRDELARLAAAEGERIGRTVPFHEIIQKLLDERKKK